jgi:hypothetical protein
LLGARRIDRKVLEIAVLEFRALPCHRPKVSFSAGGNEAPSAIPYCCASPSTWCHSRRARQYSDTLHAPHQASRRAVRIPEFLAVSVAGGGSSGFASIRFLKAIAKSLKFDA